MAIAALQFFADFMRDIALAIIKLAIFNAMKKSGNPYVAAIGTAGAASVSAPVSHSGSVVGQVSSRNRNVPSEWFAAAPRYHTGGIVGLAPDEYPAILQKGEEVLNKSDSRNILNGGLSSGSESAGGAGMRFVLVDDRSKVPEAMNSSEGDRVIVQSLKRNAATIKQLLR